jgi:hypothetical protein
LPTNEATLAPRAAPSPSTGSIRPIPLLRAQALIRFLSVPSVPSVFQLLMLESCAPDHNGNRRSGWHQQKCEYGFNGMNGLNGEGKTQGMVLDAAHTHSRRVGFDSFYW